jgi:hypothetical protein
MKKKKDGPFDGAKKAKSRATEDRQIIKEKPGANTKGAGGPAG